MVNIDSRAANRPHINRAADTKQHIERGVTGSHVSLTPTRGGPTGPAGPAGAAGPSGGPVPGGTSTDGFLVVKDTAVAGLARYQDPATSTLLLAKYVSKDALVVNALDYGAVGDGTTNDTTAINNAVTAAGTGGTVLLPPNRVYAVNSSLTLGSVRVEGPAATILKTGSAVSNFITVSSTSVGFEMLGVTIDGNQLCTGTVINLAAAASYTGASSATDTITVTHALANGDKVLFTSTGAATGITTGIIYYVVNVTGTTSFKVSATLGGSPITLGTSTANISLYRQGVTDTFLEQVAILNATAAIGVRVRDRVDNLKLRDILIDDIDMGVDVDGVVTSLTVEDVRIRNWVERGIYVVGSTTKATSDVVLVRNKVTDMQAGGTVRQPIVFEGDDANLHQRPKVLDNMVIGPNKSYTAVDPGTADQISLHRCADFEVIGNTSTKGGDGGMAIGGNSIRGVVMGNACTLNDVSGLFLGSSTSALTSTSITGNTLMNNGQNRNADRNDVGRTGIRAYTTSSCVISGNTLGDDQGTKTQKYGASFTACTSIKIGTNTDAGNALGMYNIDGTANVNIAGTDVPDVLIGTGANEIANTTTLTTVWTPAARPAGAFVVGSVFELDIGGTIDCKATSGNFTGKVLVGATVVATFTAAASQTGANTNLNWNVRVRLTVAAIGAGGTVSVFGTNTSLAAGGTTWTVNTIGTYGTAVNLGTSLAPAVQLQMGTADAANKNRINRALFRLVV